MAPTGGCCRHIVSGRRERPVLSEHASVHAASDVPTTSLSVGLTLAINITDRRFNGRVDFLIQHRNLSTIRIPIEKSSNSFLSNIGKRASSFAAVFCSREIKWPK